MWLVHSHFENTLVEKRFTRHYVNHGVLLTSITMHNCRILVLCGKFLSASGRNSHHSTFYAKSIVPLYTHIAGHILPSSSPKIESYRSYSRDHSLENFSHHLNSEERAPMSRIFRRVTASILTRPTTSLSRLLHMVAIFSSLAPRSRLRKQLRKKPSALVCLM